MDAETREAAIRRRIARIVDEISVEEAFSVRGRDGSRVAHFDSRLHPHGAHGRFARTFTRHPKPAPPAPHKDAPSPLLHLATPTGQVLYAVHPHDSGTFTASRPQHGSDAVGRRDSIIDGARSVLTERKRRGEQTVVSGEWADELKGEASPVSTKTGDAKAAKAANATSRITRAERAVGLKARPLTGPGSKPQVVTSDVDVAVKAIIEGKTVELNQPRELSTLIEKLGALAKEMEAKGEKAPVYDLCNVTVKKTSIFCADHKGIDRLHMPQLKGNPKAGSKGDALPHDAKGEVDLTGPFADYLRSKGVKINVETEKTSYLKASQRELNGAKVAGIMKYLKGGGKIESKPLFVSREGYVVDGHHRWAAEVGLDFEDNKADATMPVTRIDMPILELLDAANAFTKDWGIPQQSAAQSGKDVKEAIAMAHRFQAHLARG